MNVVIRLISWGRGCPVGKGHEWGTAIFSHLRTVRSATFGTSWECRSATFNDRPAATRSVLVLPRTLTKFRFVAWNCLDRPRWSTRHSPRAPIREGALIADHVQSPSIHRRGSVLNRPPSGMPIDSSSESAPLLESRHHDNRDRSFFSAVFHPSRPLTNLEKILTGLFVILLLLMSTFIGLFAGAQGKLEQERGKHEGGGMTQTLTATTTSTATTTISAVPTGSPKAVSMNRNLNDTLISSSP